MHKPLREALHTLGICSVEQLAAMDLNYSGHLYALLVNEIGKHKLLSVGLVEDWIIQAKHRA